MSLGAVAPLQRGAGLVAAVVTLRPTAAPRAAAAAVVGSRSAAAGHGTLPRHDPDAGPAGWRCRGWDGAET